MKAVCKFTVYNAYSANFGDIAVNMGKSRGFDIKHHIFVLKSFGSVRVIDALRVVDHISFYAVDQMYPVCLGRIGGIGKCLYNAVICNGDRFMPPLCSAGNNLFDIRNSVLRRHLRMNM